MSPAVQAKFLRVLQEREYQRLGGSRTLKADVRVLAATNRNLKAAIAQGGFREDLYYRLAVFDIALPPLRERPEDIALLVEAFLEEIGRSVGRPAAGISQEVRDTLVAYPWPGNVRELRNAIERAVILCEGGLITSEHLPLGVAAAPRPEAGASRRRAARAAARDPRRRGARDDRRRARARRQQQVRGRAPARPVPRPALLPPREARPRPIADGAVGISTPVDGSAQAPARPSEPAHRSRCDPASRAASVAWAPWPAASGPPWHASWSTAARHGNQRNAASRRRASTWWPRPSIAFLMDARRRADRRGRLRRRARAGADRRPPAVVRGAPAAAGTSRRRPCTLSSRPRTWPTGRPSSPRRSSAPAIVTTFDAPAVRRAPVPGRAHRDGQRASAGRRGRGSVVMTGDYRGPGPFESRGGVPNVCAIAGSVGSDRPPLSLTA